MPFERYYTELVNYPGAVYLPAYANILGISECGMWGVNPPNNEKTQCRTIWTKRERDLLAYYLAEAEDEIERELNFFIQPKWVVGTMAEQDDGNPKFVEDITYKRAGFQKTKWANLIQGGIKAEADIALAQAMVDKSVDPNVFTVATTVTDIDEVFIYHPGTDVQIIPSLVEISGGVLTVEIPRCRMVTEAASDNPKEGLNYTTLSNFEDTVDIKRIYNDPSTNATLVWPHKCGSECASGGCSERTQTACIYIRDSVLGIIDVQPATYSGGSWSGSGSSYCCKGANIARLYYQSGLRRITREAQQAVIRLAHTKISKEPCQCDVTGKAWQEDTNIPDVLTAERINCKFGVKEGAWLAYQWTLAQKTWRGGQSF